MGIRLESSARFLGSKPLELSYPLPERVSISCFKLARKINGAQFEWATDLYLLAFC